MSIFHYACLVTDLDAARAFYGGVLGCREAAAAASWVDFDFFGHQLSLHLQPASSAEAIHGAHSGRVDGVEVPVPHFGAVLDLQAWQDLAERLTRTDVSFVLPPALRYAGQPGEQYTLFIRDPSGNSLEFKALPRASELFER